jgi:F-type H+-transporting ATPase subunit b
MPQLEMGDYAPQIFWLVVTFVVLMILMWSIGLPRIRRVIEAREGKVADDLAQAENLKQQAEAALKAYEDALSEARSQAHSVLAEAYAELDAEATKLRDRLDAELAAKSDEAEARIRAAREQAMASLRDVASDVARSATERLVGAVPSEAAANAAVDATMGEGR